MHAAVQRHRAGIEELCRRYGVTQLDGFGSATRDDFDEATSDVDFLVEFEDVPGLRALRQYFGFKEGLEELLGRPVDLVEGQIEDAYLTKSMVASRESLYAA